MSPRSYERGAISSADRKNPRVRLWLGLTQALILIGLLVACLGPLLWLFKAAVSSTQEILADPFGMLFNGEFQVGNLARAWTDVRVGDYLLNTAWVVLGSWVATLVTCVTGAYVLSVLRPKWGGLLSAAVLATLFIPNIVSLVPLYLTVLELPGPGWRLLDTYWAVWLPHAASAFLVLIVKRFFDQIPAELYEAARIDGAGPVRVLFSIVLPMSRPILGVVSLLTIVAAWKDYLWPLLVLPDPGKQPISVALPKVADSFPLNVQMAALFIAVVIPVGLFLVFQRQFLDSAGNAGALKG
ncbi:carbohydrate ABC transporter permease [Jiangella alba]|uniref:Multiple sugar transport system permease protein n=1 Tax=Jiangella alba TaxID=561176 RepID=A0A1H5MX61_9ACTN|nr:carbohydrate ABC transporter permease [Jiangella alba]SEE93873.1 multiple sugar transport system permease protein [Jiangella alba]